MIDAAQASSYVLVGQIFIVHASQLVIRI